MNSTHLLDHDFMNRLFPFYILLDKNLKVVRTGNSITQLYTLSKNTSFFDFFEIERPINFHSNVSFEQLNEFSDHLFILKSLKIDLKMRGQMLCEKDYIAFLGTPLIQSLNDLQEHQLNMQHFAVHDNITQFLFSLQMHISSLEDAQYLTEKLKKSNHDLKESNAAMDEFMYRLTHDLRAPAININNMSNMLDKMTVFEEGSKADTIFSHLSTSSDKLLQIIDDFLLVSKIERTDISPPEHLSLKTIFDEIEKSLESIIIKENVSISYDLQHSNIYISIEDIRSILQNLIHNAIKYSDKAPKIDISSYIQENEIFIKIKDYGIGMDLTKYKSKLFKMFSRLHSQTDIEGTGIGLYLVKQLIERNHGAVNIESIPNQGTTFFLSFPQTHK